MSTYTSCRIDPKYVTKMFVFLLSFFFFSIFFFRGEKEYLRLFRCKDTSSHQIDKSSIHVSYFVTKKCTQDV